MEITYLTGLVLCALGYLANSALVFNSQAKGVVRSMFIMTFVAMLVWSVGYLVFWVASDSTIISVSPLLESIQLGIWTLLLLAILDAQKVKTSRFLKGKYALTITFVILIFNFAIVSPFFDQASRLQLMIAASLLGCIIQLILIEQIYRAAGDDKWAYKPLVLGLAMVNIFHLVMMSNSLLLNNIDINYLAARPFIYAMLAPFLLLSMKRVNDWNLRVFISRDVVLHSSLLVFAGAYLMLMAATGYYIQQTGQSWSGVLQIVFIAGALVALAYIFISDSLRKYFKTFIQKHFYANQFDYREEWLNLTQTLDQHDVEKDFYLTGLSGVCNSLYYQKGAYLRQQFNQLELVTPDVFGLTHDVKMELDCIVAQLEKTHWILDLPDFDKEEYRESFANCSVTALQKQGVEIVLPIYINNKLHGVFLLSSAGRDRIVVNWEVRDYLTAVSSQVASFIRSGETRERLEENAKFAAFNRMSAFVVHDLKNVIAQIGMIVTNAEKHRNNPEFIDDTFETLAHTKERMDKMLSQLKEKQQQRSAQPSLIELNETLSAVTQQYQNSQPAPNFVKANQPVSVPLDKDRFSSVIGHLIDNAQQATDENGTVLVKLLIENNPDIVKVIISDTGIGMTQDFIDNLLFKPFETTKGNAGMGVGVYEAKTFAQECGGILTVDSEVNVGTTFVMQIPLSNVVS